MRNRAKASHVLAMMMISKSEIIAIRKIIIPMVSGVEARIRLILMVISVRRVILNNMLGW